MWLIHNRLEREMCELNFNEVFIESLKSFKYRYMTDFAPITGKHLFMIYAHSKFDFVPKVAIFLLMGLHKYHIENDDTSRGCPKLFVFK